jgi:hypothetical protein
MTKSLKKKIKDLLAKSFVAELLKKDRLTQTARRRLREEF